ncbi:SDR family NAD(P)-dependent oxidoreductase, partial [Phytoactinopolyspora halophila]
MTFEEVWESEGVGDFVVGVGKRVVVFSSDPVVEGVLRGEFEGRGDWSVVFVGVGDGFERVSERCFRVGVGDVGDVAACFSAVEELLGGVDCVVYLWGVEDRAHVVDASGLVCVIQGLSRAGVRPERLVVGAEFGDGLERCYAESLIGFSRSLRMPLAGTFVSVVCRERVAGVVGVDASGWAGVLWDELNGGGADAVLYEGVGSRQVCRVRPVGLDEDCGGVLRRGGTYLITGGMGGLGKIFSDWLAAEYGANLVLVGRGELDDRRRARVQELELAGASVVYVSADVGDAAALRAAVEQGKARFGGIDGVIHAAGLESRRSVVDKDVGEFHRVVRPKVAGTLALDEALSGESVDFVCYFSSSSAILGDFGGCDYAVGNRFLMSYAQYREAVGGPGRAVVINWPLWNSEGMGVADADAAAFYLKSSGQRFLEAAEGTALFERLLGQSRGGHLVLVGEPAKVARFVGVDPAEIEVGVCGGADDAAQVSVSEGDGGRVAGPG